MIMSPCHNYIMNSATENFIANVFTPPWSFSYKKIISNWGYPVPGVMKNKLAIMSMTYGGNIFSIQTWFQNMPFRRIKAGVLKLGGMKIKYLRFYEVLPGMEEKKFSNHMEKVRKLFRNL